MGRNVTQVEKDLMWELYQKYGTFKKVADIMGRGRDTVSRYVHEHEAAVGVASVVMNVNKIKYDYPFKSAKGVATRAISSRSNKLAPKFRLLNL